MKKILSILLASAFCLAACSCKEKKSEEGETLAPSDVAVWTAGGTEKILQDKDYTSRHANGTLTFNAFRNETESAQIILSPSKEVESYTLILNDLKNDDGDVLKADSFEVYNQKYILVNNIKELNAGVSVGYYPDALLPYETAVEYGENSVEAGKNQGLWVVLQPEKEQKAGVYSGSFTVQADGLSFKVPVQAQVYDYTLSDETHSKSSFMLKTEEIALGELNSTEEMYVKYYEYLLEHRVNPQNLPGNGLEYTVMKGERLERFLDYAEKYAQDPRCSSFNIPFNIISATYIKDSGEISNILSVDFDMFEDTLRAMAERSKETGVNLLKKAGTYFIFFDEYDLNGSEDEANYNIGKAYKLCEELAAELSSEGYSEEICAAVGSMQHKLVGGLSDKLIVDKAQMVPRIERFHSEEEREKYYAFSEQAFGEDAELWWYTCGYPFNPMPTYHIEDNLISSRLLSWMMYDYGVVGNLYWDAAMYAWREPVSSGTSFDNLQLQDYYGTALRYPDANGDGFLLYPGRPYGIDGPVGSVRLQSILDGNEDYDLMYALEELYKERGIADDKIDSVMDMLFRGLYSGVQVQYNDDLLQTFQNSRDLLAQLLIAAENGLVVENFVRGNGKGMVAFSAPSAATVTVEGEEIEGTVVGEYKRYTIEQDLTETVNTLTISMTAGDKTSAITLNLGGRSVSYEGKSIVGNINFLPAGSGSVVEENVDGENCASMQFNAPEGENLRQTANIDVSAFGITNRTQKFTLRIYAEESFTLSILKKNTDGGYSSVRDYKLAAGWNEIVLTAEMLNVGSNVLETLRFNVTDKATATKLSIGQIQIEE